MAVSPIGFNRETGKFETIPAPRLLRHLETWTYSTAGVGEVTFTGLDAINYVVMLLENVTPSAIGYLAVRLSSDAGSTFGPQLALGSGSTGAVFGRGEVFELSSTVSARIVPPNFSVGTPIVLDTAVARNALRIEWTFSRTFTAGKIHLFGI